MVANNKKTSNVAFFAKNQFGRPYWTRPLIFSENTPGFSFLVLQGTALELLQMVKGITYRGGRVRAQPGFACLNSTIETPEQYVKYVQS